MASSRGPRTPRVWTDRWVREQSHSWWNLRKTGSESAQRMWKRVDRHNRERAQKGYSVYDWWNFDTFVCGLIANACRDFRLKSHGHPTDMPKEEWYEFLLGIETPLRVYAEDKFDMCGDDALKVYEDAKAAMHRFADRLGNFWD